MFIYVYVSFGAFKSWWKVRIYTLGLHNYVIRYVQITLDEERYTCNLINIKLNNIFKCYIDRMMSKECELGVFALCFYLIYKDTANSIGT